jgi:hypothetical protein
MAALASNGSNSRFSQVDNCCRQPIFVLRILFSKLRGRPSNSLLQSLLESATVNISAHGGDNIGLLKKNVGQMKILELPTTLSLSCRS